MKRSCLHVCPAGLLWTALLLALSVVPCQARQQEETGEETGKMERIGGLGFKEEMELTVVNIDVFVRDKDGKPIEGLSADDFVVFQDGTQKEITHFATYSEEYFHQRLPVAAVPQPTPEVEETPQLAADQPEPEPIYIVLYIDNENLRIFDRNRVLRHAREFVRDSMGPYVQMMVAAYQRSFKVVQPFTDDAQAIQQALREQKKVVGGRTEKDTQRGRILHDIRQAYQERTGTRSAGGRYYHELYDRVRTYADETDNDLGFTLQAIRQVGNMIAGLPGRKYLVYISNGLPLVPGKDLMYEFSTINQETPLLSFMAPYNRKARYEALASAANAQGMTFYTIDASGIDMASEVSAEHASSPGSAAFMNAENTQVPLQMLAEKTGGLAVVGTNNFAGGFEKIKSDLFTYYSLGYTISSSGNDKVHHINVELPNQPGTHLRYRRTFVEKSLESNVQDEVMSGLMFDLDDNPMQVTTSAGAPAPAAEGRWVLPVEVSFPMRSVALIPVDDKNYEGRVVLFVAARDTKGKQSDLQRQVHLLEVPQEDYTTRQDDKFVIDLQLLMEPGSYRVAIGLLDQTTRQASYTTFREYIREPE